MAKLLDKDSIERKNSHKLAYCAEQCNLTIQSTSNIDKHDNTELPSNIHKANITEERSTQENNINMNSDQTEHSGSENLPHIINSKTDETETSKYYDTNFRTNSTRKKLMTSASVSSALLKTRETAISTTDLSEFTENIRKIKDELTVIRLSIETLTEMKNDQQKSINSEVQSLKPVLKKVKFIETPFTIEDPLKFRLECNGRMYEAIYDARCQRTLVGPAYVDENKIRKLTVRERVKIYVPGKKEPLLAISEVADATFKLSTTTFTIEAAVHRERNTPIILGKDFGQHFIIGISMEHKILTLKDDTAVPIAINFELYT